MRKTLLAAFVLSFFVVASGYAQFTGPSLLSTIRDGITKQTGLKAELAGSQIALKDPRSGAELFVVREVDKQTVTLSSVVMKLGAVTPAQREKIWKKIAFFNYSSGVGTLWLDQATGIVTMEHHLNPRYVTPSSMAAVAAAFGDVVRAQAKSLRL